MIKGFSILLMLCLLACLPGATSPAVAQSGTRIYVLQISSACGDQGPDCPVVLRVLGPVNGGQDATLGPVQEGTTFPQVRAIALSPTGKLYGTDGSTIFSIDTLCTGGSCAATPLASGLALAGDSLQGIAFHPDGRLFGVTRYGKLGIVNLHTAAFTVLHDYGSATLSDFPALYASGLGFDGGLTFGADGSLYATAFGCPKCEFFRDPGPVDDGLVKIPGPLYDTPSLLQADAGFQVIHGLVLVAGATEGSAPVLLGTTGVQMATTAHPSPPCTGTGVLISLDRETAAAQRERCLTFVAGGATANPLLPPAVASVALHPTVPVGSKQAIHVTASPDTLTRVTVTYPNGDREVRKAITDPKGLARFTWVQRASKITHLRSVATVQIDVGSGPTQVTRIEHYAIGYGAIDLSLEPRHVHPGGWVNVYVHTTRYTRVQADLLFPSSVLVPLTGRTGPAGWAHIRYWVPTTRDTTAIRTVLVLAVRRHGSPAISTTSSFVIQSSQRHS